MTSAVEPGPRIGIIGTGAIGGFYGLMLARAGFDVHFLLRSEFAAVSERGLQLNSAVHGALRLHPVQAYASAADMPPCDWLLVGTKTTGNVELAPTIAEVAAPDAKVVLLQNGLAVEDGLREHLPESLHLLGGLCYICVHRSGPGIVEHQAMGRVSLGYHSGTAIADAARRQAIVEEGAGLFRHAGIDAQAMPDLDQARWHKLVWNVPYNGLSVLLGANTSQLMADESSRELIQGLMAEVVQGAQACGHEIAPGYPEQMFSMTERLTDYWPSMYHDHLHRRPLELAAIYARPLAAARAAGCELPRMQALYQALSFIDRRND
ncbi:putative 2-dehydropantoate 2-reductase [Pseudomonas fluorescens]|jgi:2-dehydropantoate 2-reductase|uniref:putative 2-dehydropantoate 2-reductase n=1 Tax=Pseudomonas TaxID=286 RepID=UPI0007CF86FF|nr:MULTISPECIES: putative 2-dehydropantoate 2-reductase [Pseudomonas]AYG07346.1 putative 2-dehydropantoate 2-reductase [Pseudomonas fluorescens]MDZ4300401.1 putative 2-dehydropantoate 2-reductase [Pseudomonas sp.]OAE16095.1 2-dehydropantoate 2-reductase [Pseudomonas brenneri]MBJ2252902.1 putative 2-dehydropantoate 2-reductase [Pseudomonas sp. MF6784]MBJ2263440.1 putative 2-dehydropantoate 2-reductase [Pseudomonas sp. MF6787]